MFGGSLRGRGYDCRRITMAGHASITEVSGKDSLIYVSGTEIFGANEWTLALDHSTITYSCFGDDYNGTFSGTYGWSGALTAIHDNDAEVLHAAATYDGTVALLVYPVNSVGTDYWSGDAVFSWGASGGMTAAIGETASFVGDGALASSGFAA